MDDVILILSEEDPESAAWIKAVAAENLQVTGWSVLLTPAGAYITFCLGMEYHFLLYRDGYAMKVYSDGEVALNADVYQYLPEYK